MDEMNKLPEMEDGGNDSQAESSNVVSGGADSEGNGKKVQDKPKKSNKALPFIIIIGAVVLVAVALALVLMLGGKSGIQIGSGSNNGASQNGGGNNNGSLGENEETHQHDFKNSSIATEATCFEGGLEELSCSCGEKKERSISRLDHSLENGFCPLCNTAWNIVDSADDFKNMDLYGNYILICDIDLEGEVWSPLGTRDTPFYGHINGNGHTVSGLKIEGYCYEVGLVGYNNGVIENLGLIDVNIDARGDNIGGIAGQNYGLVSNCYVEGIFNVGESSNDYDNTIGGLVGFNRGPVANCYTNCVITAEGDVTKRMSVGGLVGENYDYSITNCYALGDITVNLPSSAYVGGLIGSNNSADVINCFATGNVDATAYRSAYVGGFMGTGSGGIYENCYATGDVVGLSDSHKSFGDSVYCYAGGFAATCGRDVVNCFATGNVTAKGNSYTTYAGGFTGSESGTLTNCYCADDQTVTIIKRGTSTTTPTNTRAPQTSKENLASKNWIEANLWVEESFVWSFGESYPEINYSAFKNKTVEISTAEELLQIAQRPLIYNYVLTGDIDLEGAVITAIASANYPLIGTFDGRGYKIYNFTLNANSTVTGLFGINAGTIKNLTIKECGIFDSDYRYNYFGSLVGGNYGTIENCSAESYIFGMGRIGGLASYNLGHIIDCNAIAEIEFSFNDLRAGGIAGNNTGTIISSYAIANVKPYHESRGSQMYVGGLVGENYYGVIYASFAEINFAKGSTCEFSAILTGGLVGLNLGKINLSYAAGNINVSGAGYYSVGGLVGTNSEEGIIENSYAVTAIESAAHNRSGSESIVGGIAGLNRGKILNCFGMGSLSSISNCSSGYAYAYAGGVVGKNESGALIENSIANGNITCSSSGGGRNSSYVCAGGVVGSDYGSAYGNSNVNNSYRYEGQLITITKYGTSSDNLANDLGTLIGDEEILKGDFYREILLWSDEIWGIQDEKIPTLLIFHIN